MSPSPGAIRVAHIIETLGTGGAEILLLDVTRILDGDRFHSRVFPLEEPLDLAPRFAAAGVEVAPVGVSPRRRPLRCLARLARELRIFRPAIVHTHLYYANVLGRIAARMAGSRCVVTTLHNPDYTFESKPTLFFAARKAADRITGHGNAALVAVSDAVKRDYERQMGWRAIRVIPNGVDVDRFSPDGARADAGLWPGQAARVLSVGRLHPQKGHEALFAAVARCRERGVALSLALVGEGPLRERLESSARRLGIDDRVRFLGRRADIPALLRAADVFVLPSLYEAVGIALLEAMACGVAIVASRTGGIPEVVDDGVSGMLVPPGDSAALADALERLVRDPGQRARLGLAGRQRAQAFDIRTTVRELESLYAEISERPCRA